MDSGEFTRAHYNKVAQFELDTFLPEEIEDMIILIVLIILSCVAFGCFCCHGNLIHSSPYYPSSRLPTLPNVIQAFKS